MDCTPAQKVRYGTHMLAKEADDWWLEMLARLEFSGEEVTWNVFRREFLRKYYPEDVRGKKEIEFLELTQGNKSVTEYAAKFTELIKFYPHFDGEGDEFSKCIKFQNGLRSEIKKVVGYQKIRLFSDLVDSCRIFEEDSNAHHKIVSDRRGKNQQSRGKPYDAGKRKQRVTHGQRCGKMGHAMSDCKHKDMVCFTCGEEGHIGSQCPKKKAQSGGKVFALAETPTVSGDRLIRAPKSATEIRSFLGLAGYYRRFIEGFSKLALPLTRLTCKGKTFVWDVQCEESFNEMKKRLTSAPVLTLPNPGEPFVVYWDACLMGLDGVLM
ncbi:uncharacterized protein LOC131627620 [Vicia villosa]|uniref:uncharacterized protein LOC131627620 n=1 Tax=Vicia villosa TaxID=3911 RepID=UPI00273AD1B8|nr:uncharacterized protein LOC131627620 [Vicia villosa]